MAANLDVTRLYRFCKDRLTPFSTSCLYFSITAVNEIRVFRFRMIDERVVEFYRIEATPHALRDGYHVGRYFSLF
ncbi:MAG: hypothetical protein PSX80_00845 [bacterium]|nr:hypothetical protein [bacterium]